ncbi:MAG: glycosyltransferase [Methanobrevibacter arboriphilus]|uniref:Glycosyltransferase n=1 Tax=Methanobrevibacter arboriphilus TaxID=39441 RepID=A0A843AF41_METAZ|nr:glycosyltransferase [Methanobrevibacter arboriphilus]MBF4469324.1 glycosyltransferase [Methanobrevibacter arboriphilus]
MKVLHLTTFKKCGIADYFNYLIKEIDNIGNGEIVNDVFPVDVDWQKKSNFNQVSDYYNEFVKKSENYDLIHIQHEYHNFTGNYPKLKSLKLFNNILEKLKSKNVIVTFHSNPLPIIHNRVLSPIFKNYSYSQFFKNGNMKALVHNTISKEMYLKSGFDLNSIITIFHPTPNIIEEYPEKNMALKDEIYRKLNLNNDSIVLSIVGFIHKYKGYDDIIKLLTILPDNYKLIILGDKHPRGTDSYYNKLLNNISKNSLENRVFITGYYDEKDLSTYCDLIDIFLAPYSSKFTSGSGAIQIGVQSKKPTIAYDIESFKDLNKEFEPICLVKEGNIGELKDKIIKIADNNELKDYYIDQAKKYLLDNSYYRLAKQTIEIYNDFME